MNIAVNTRLLLPNKLEGIGWFSYETLKRIVKNHPEHTFYFIFDRPYSQDFIFSNNIIPIVAGMQARHPLLFYIWFEITLPKIFKRINADVFLSPDGYISLTGNIKTLQVIHDINFEHFSDNIPFLSYKHYKYFFPKYAEKSTRICTVSQYSKQDIIKTYNIPEEKIDVVYNGCNELYAPITTEKILETRRKYAYGAPYFLYVGSLHPRKNIANLLKAFDIYKLKTRAITKLLIVGEKYYWTKEMDNTFNDLTYCEDIIFLGRIGSAKLKNILSSAVAVTYVSLFEGFGIPILEAMYSGVPVITSSTTSMPEVGGDAVLYADPYSIDSIAEAMIKLDADKALQQTLVAKGNIQKQKFSWDKTAEKLWESLEKIMQ